MLNNKLERCVLKYWWPRQNVKIALKYTDYSFITLYYFISIHIKYLFDSIILRGDFKIYMNHFVTASRSFLNKAHVNNLILF